VDESTSTTLETHGFPTLLSVAAFLHGKLSFPDPFPVERTLTRFARSSPPDDTGLKTNNPVPSDAQCYSGKVRFASESRLYINGSPSGNTPLIESKPIYIKRDMMGTLHNMLHEVLE
jgi:hypothetical protein